MEIFLSCIVLAAAIFFLSMGLLRRSPSGLPPGTKGWPVIGETLEFLSTGWKGHPERFVLERMERLSRRCFRTSLLGESEMVVMCGAQGNKFLFSNEGRLVEVWWPPAVKRLLFSSWKPVDPNFEARKTRVSMQQFLKPEALRRFVGVMDGIARRHFAESWEGRDHILVFPLAKRYTFWLACKLFISLEDPDQITRFSDPFLHLASGLVTFPINFPGTSFYRAMKAAKLINKELIEVIKKRKLDLANNKATPNQDILSHMLTAPIEAGTGEEKKFMNEDDIANIIIGLLLAGHDSSSAAITFIIKYLAELPHVYDLVYEEQMEIARTKGDGELLTWDDIQKMKYSWNVACEVMRLSPPLQGAFREALHDFTFSDFRIPKGWKLYWNTNSTHRNPENFPEPEKFDPTRFEGSGPAPYTFVPFGGGPRMCPGKEYARLEILVFMHHVVKRFKWQKLIENEQVIINPLPMPSKGLPIRILSQNTFVESSC
ncbi:hypothetical protein V2J09_000302 [Rumex salicifolius]